MAQQHYSGPGRTIIEVSISHTVRHTTICWTPLDDGSARRRYPIQHTTLKTILFNGEVAHPTKSSYRLRSISNNTGNCQTLEELTHFKNYNIYQNLTFIGPCIVIYSYNENQRDGLFLKFILVKNSICFGQT